MTEFMVTDKIRHDLCSEQSPNPLVFSCWIWNVELPSCVLFRNSSLIVDLTAEISFVHRYTQVCLIPGMFKTNNYSIHNVGLPIGRNKLSPVFKFQINWSEDPSLWNNTVLWEYSQKDIDNLQKKPEILDGSNLVSIQEEEVEISCVVSCCSSVSPHELQFYRSIRDFNVSAEYLLIVSD